MRKHSKHGLRKLLALIMALAMLLSLAACAETPAAEPTETEPTETEPTEPHVHAFVDGVCQCGESSGWEGLTIETAEGLTAVEREDTDTGMLLTSANAPGEADAIRLTKELDGVQDRFYEVVYRFTSNVDGTVRFVSDDAVYYESNEFEVKKGENEIAVRFAAGKDGKVPASLELGALGAFELSFSEISCQELAEDLGKHFLDVADQASGRMEKNADGHLITTFKANEGWRVKLAVDRTLVKGKTYETTYVFRKTGGQAQNVTYTVYDGAATILGSKTHWVEEDLCVATFYFTANANVTKGTCLEIGLLSGGEEVNVTFTYVDFREVGSEKLAKLQKENPFPGVGVWTEASLKPAVGTQSAQGLALSNPNPATDWWKVKLEKDLDAKAGSYYKMTYSFTSDAAGKIKFVNDDATYYGSNEYTVQKGENTFTVEFKYGGNPYSCLELGGLGQCELLFTEIAMEQIEKPTQPVNNPNATTRFGSFKVWNDASVEKPLRSDTATTMTVTSKNAPTDWWKIKLEKDISGKAGQSYEVTYTFTSEATGRIKFVNDDATYFTPNEYDVVAGENTFTIQFKYGGKPYSCLELGSLGENKLVFTNYTIKAIEEPTTNGFESFRTQADGSVEPITREDTATSMIVTSTNAATDWWKVKVEKDLDCEAGKYYEMVFTFTSDAAGRIKFHNDGATFIGGQEYDVVVGENTFTLKFQSAGNAYSCLELGGLGAFRLEFTGFSLTETAAPEIPEEHEHVFTNGTCSCGQTNGFASYRVQADASVESLTRVDTASTMKLISTNAATDWWKVKLEWDMPCEAGKYYEMVFTFNSNAAGDIKFFNDGATVLTSDVYNVVAGSNTFAVKFQSAGNAYSCLELGGLGAFELEFASITLTETEAPTPPEEHEHVFTNGTCSCGQTNGFASFRTWTEGSLQPLTREDTASTMKVTSTNAAGDWWKVKLERDLSCEAGKTYEITFAFTSNAAGRIKFANDGCTIVEGSAEYDVVAGSNTWTIKFQSAGNAYSCLELGGLGAFELEFTGFSLTETAAPEEHEHVFTNGACSCGQTNGFASFRIWTEGSLLPLTREDTATYMKVTSTNAAGDWWKVKLERDLSCEAGKTYEITFVFTSNAAGRIKFVNDGYTVLDGSAEYDVVAGTNTWTIKFQSAGNAYSCLELGGLGAFELIFSSFTLTEVA